MTPPPAALGRRSGLLFRLFSLYLHWYVSRHFHAMRVDRAGLPKPGAGPLIVYSNHPSWWDPAVYILLSAKLFPHKESFGPMAAEALGRYGVLERMGVFPVPPGPAGAVVFLRTALAVLARPRGMMWITAEGQFTDNRLRPIRLRPGLAHLARRVPGAVILPLALDYPFWNESRPEALARFGDPVSLADGSVEEWTHALEHALTTTMDALADSSGSRDPRRFQPLVRGGAGVGGLYDLWRRLKALAAGRHFDAGHDAGSGA